MHEEQLDILRGLSEKVHIVYIELRNTELVYLLALEELYKAKLELAGAIDEAYIRGEVEGKNERERDAHLKILLPMRHKAVYDADAKVRETERAFRVNQRDAERLALQAKIGHMALLIQVSDIPTMINIAQPQYDPGPNVNPHKPSGT